MQSDSFFTMGEAHSAHGMPCQDYAYSEVTEDHAMAIVCDGCSSSPNTDVGARIIAHAARNRLTDWHPAIFDPGSDIKTTLGVYSYLVPTQDTLDATLVYALVKDDLVHAGIFGDGAIACRYQDGTTYTIHVAWSYKDKTDGFINSAPPYLSYQLNGARWEALRGVYMASAEPEQVCTKTTTWTSPSGEIATSVDHYTFDEAARGMYPTIVRSGLVDIAVFTDGVDFVEGVSYDEVIKNLMAFKNTKGRFVHRRMRGFLRDLAKNELAVLDDLGMAALHIEP